MKRTYVITVLLFDIMFFLIGWYLGEREGRISERELMIREKEKILIEYRNKVAKLTQEKAEIYKYMKEIQHWQKMQDIINCKKESRGRRYIKSKPFHR